MSRKRWPLLQAEQVANEIVYALRSTCERIMIAGSIRRRCETVGDIEIVYVPRLDFRGAIKGKMFAEKIVSLTTERLEQMLVNRKFVKWHNKLGRTTWGKSNKLAVHVSLGIPVDFFATSLEAWWNILVGRTGPVEMCSRIATAALARGLRWRLYSPGFEEIDTGRVVPVMSEREVFETVGLDYLEPEER